MSIPGLEDVPLLFQKSDAEVSWIKLCVAASKKDMGLAMQAITTVLRIWSGKTGADKEFETLGEALVFLDKLFREREMRIWISSIPADCESVMRHHPVKNVQCVDQFSGNAEKPRSMYLMLNKEDVDDEGVTEEERLRLLLDAGTYQVTCEDEDN